MAKNKKSWKAKRGSDDSKEEKNITRGSQWVQELKNEKFEQYYRAQNLMPADEWATFFQMLREPLPTTFRLAGSRDTVHELNNIVRYTYVPQLSNVTFEGVNIPPPKPISWYPEGLAWQLNVPKSVIRRSPEFKRFHNFLVYETDVGNISRQEAVSMIPPLFLDVEPHHLVLDMCAAPGSKTAQLLEAMHAYSSDQKANACHIPPGLLIANDSDFKRTHLLVHQSSRLPSAALMVTNLDASNYPNIALMAPSESSSNARPSVQSAHVELLKFDRILCDVPCSGDGTLRKNIGIWDNWQPMDANGLHGLQLRILLRAMKLLKPAGRIVYSTCSLNPVENEAVIAAALKAAPDFELVDVSSRLPSLIRKPGLETWYPVADKELTMFASYNEYCETIGKGGSVQPTHAKLAETHFPPLDVVDLHLTRCLRIYPHLQDMGGFFVAVLARKDWNSSVIPDTIPRGTSKRAASQEPATLIPNSKRAKESDIMNTILAQDVHGIEAGHGHLDDSDVDLTSNVPTTSAHSLVASGNNEATRQSKAFQRNLDPKFKEPPYTFLGPNHPQMRQTIDRLCLVSSFPTSNIFVRNPSGGDSAVPLRSMYLCNDMVKRVILANDYAKIRLVAAGTKAFTRQDTGGSSNGECQTTTQQFRILDDAVPVILPFIPPASILSGRSSDLKILLEAYYPLIAAFEDPFRTLLYTKENGNHLIRFHVDDRDDTSRRHPFVLPLWKSNASVSLMTDKKSKSALSLRVFGEDITIFGKQSLEKQAASQARRNAAVKEPKA